jgi:hypothetical protein
MLTVARCFLMMRTAIEKSANGENTQNQQGARSLDSDADEYHVKEQHPGRNFRALGKLDKFSPTR